MAKPETIILTTLFAMVAVVVGFMSYFKAFESGLVVTTVAWIGAFIVMYTFLRIAHMRDLLNQKEKEKEEDLDYCWTQVNRMLTRMPGGLQITWEKGSGGNVQGKVFSDHANRPNFFYAFVAFSVESQTYQIIYYNATKKNIWSRDTNPQNRDWKDLFAGYKPYDKTGSGMNPNFYGGKNNQKFKLEFGGNDPTPTGNYNMPSQEYVSDSYGRMNGGGNDE